MNNSLYSPPKVTKYGEITALTNATFQVSDAPGGAVSGSGDPDCPDYGLWFNLTSTPVVVPGSALWPGSGFDCYVPY